MRTSWGRRLVTAVTAVGLTSAGLLGATPAQAAVGDCPKGYFCAWQTDNATGTMFKTDKSVATLGSWDNKIRTIVNRTSQHACLHSDANYADSSLVAAPDPAAANWGGPGTNSLSSVKLVPTARECRLPAYPEWSSTQAMYAADFGDMNGDQRADVVVRDQAGRLWFLPGDLTGRMIGSAGWNGMSALTRHGDFSRDGREDVIAAEASTGKLWLYPGAGTGALGARTLIGSGGWNGMAQITAFGDLTRDGRSDLVAIEKSTGKLWLYPGTASGGLGARKLIGSGGWNGMNDLVGAGDMNGDSHADLLAREASTGKLWFYPGGPGYIGARKLVGSGWNTMRYIIGVGDFSGRGPGLAASTTHSYTGPNCWSGACVVKYAANGMGGVYPGEPQPWDWSDLNGAF